MPLTASPVQLGVALGTEESSTNTANTVVKRDGSGNFSAGTITASLTGNVTGNATGNAGTATKWQTARNLSLTGDVTATLTSVDGGAAVSAAATIADDAVTADKLRDDASTDANRAVTTNHIRDGAVTAAKLNSGVPICRAWVCFDGTKDVNGTASGALTDRLIKASHNVSSVTKITNDAEYTVTFASGALTDANYAFSGTANFSSSLFSAFITSDYNTALTTSKTSSLLRISCMQAETSVQPQDPHDVCVMVFR